MMETFLMVMAVLIMVCTVGVTDGTAKKCLAAEFIAVMAVLTVAYLKCRL